MKTILVPTDFSKYAENALEYALDLSKKMNANVRLLHIIEQSGLQNIDTISGGYAGAGQADVIMLQMLEKTKKQLADMEKEYGVETEIKFTSSVTNEIINYSKEIKADLVVMGSKGTNTLDEEIVGSNTEKIVRNAVCPVLTVKEKGTPHLNDIVFASDFKSVNAKVIEQIKYYQELYSSNLHLLRVCTPHNFDKNFDIESKMDEIISKFGLKNCTKNIFNDFYEEDGIAEFAAHYNYDLICLATSGRTGMSHFFTGSIAEDVVNHSNTPVLTFNLKTIDA